MSNKEINERLWDALPTVPVPNLEEARIAAEFRAVWDGQHGVIGTPEQLAELFYRKGRVAGKDAASREILGRR